MKIEDVYKDIAGDELPIPPGRKYLRIELGGACLDLEDTDFQMPSCQYYFEKK